MIWPILAAAMAMPPLPENMGDMTVLTLSKDIMYVAEKPRIVDGLNEVATIMVLGSKITDDTSAPVIAASTDIVNCKTNQWKSPRVWFYTIDGKPIDGRDNQIEWVTAKAGTKAMGIVEAACSPGASSAQLPGMPFKTLVAIYQRYRAAN